MVIQLNTCLHCYYHYPIRNSDTNKKQIIQ